MKTNLRSLSKLGSKNPMYGKPSWCRGTKGVVKAWNKNMKFPEFSGKNHPLWKGDSVGYGSLHEWVVRNLGKPSTCEHCGKTNLVGQKIHWANKSQKYKRDINDWIRLCVRCHYIYDCKMNVYTFKPKTNILIKCKMCLNKFRVIPYDIKLGVKKYCSKECYTRYQNEC